MYRNAVLSALLVSASFVMPDAAIAFDLNGAWVSDAENCAKVFVRKGAQVTFTDMSDVYGGGFIIDGDQITGKYARCRIRAKKNEGADINLLAACASDIMLQNVQFNLKEVDANTVIRMFPGIAGMEIKYARCPAP
ncbi:hypothetical protein [Bradyrhizobium sp. CB3481]|uniref:hypothetical protein n=1 Tax=Bradyrhizobium sp. CB3481 TaxID=3039158 RepID=UPI0024B0DA00|nr:hypothetical protein [Bradyrhizobium sp. CB3481]WFU18523.1 hypothetical protein QA643_09340 [Bradyrhizobium sp. CB3481]